MYGHSHFLAPRVNRTVSSGFGDLMLRQERSFFPTVRSLRVALRGCSAAALALGVARFAENSLGPAFRETRAQKI